MNPIIIGIGGSHSGAGKTTVASSILKTLEGWGAVKYTKTSLYSSIVDDIEVLSEEGKDTRKFLDSGAEKVLWVQAPFNGLRDILPMAVEMLSYLRGIVVEGNSAIEILKPDIVIFVAGREGNIKRGAEKILAMADVIIYEHKIPPDPPEKAKKFKKNDIGKVINHIKKVIEDLQNRDRDGNITAKK